MDDLAAYTKVSKSTRYKLAVDELVKGENAAAVLLFGKQPQRFLITSEVKGLQFHGTTVAKPLLAEPLFLTRHIEKAGTGILDMIGLCKAAKLRPPEFRQEMGQFIQTLWRPTSVIGGPVGAQSEAQVGQAQPTQSATQSPTQSSDPVGRLLLALKTGPKSAGELRELLDLKHRPTFRENYLHPALEMGVIENTIPDKPNSRLQKYRLTDKGRARLEEKA